MAYLKVKILIYLVYKAQIALLLAEKIIVLDKYLDFINILLKKLAIKLFEHFAINKHLINPEPGKQLFYNPIYSLGLLELKILKIYIKIKLATYFI